MPIPNELVQHGINFFIMGIFERNRLHQKNGLRYSERFGDLNLPQDGEASFIPGLEMSVHSLHDLFNVGPNQGFTISLEENAIYFDFI